MDYPETLEYLFTQLPMYQRQGAAAMKKDLTNIRVLLEWLGNPHDQLRCIHVAGTNGKGTVCHLLAAALQQYGYRVAMYTSPHYKDFRERIKIDGQFIPEADVIDFTARLRDAELGIEASFFEITVAMAFDYFAREAPDFCVVEVGLGGRLDSTNIITPIVSVITNIGLDHTQFLGDTLPEIAGEKAGIIKQGIPVIIGQRQADTAPVFIRIAESLDADLMFAEDYYQWQPEQINLQGEEEIWIHRLYENDDAHPLPVHPKALVESPTQRQNMVTAVATLEELSIQGYLNLNFQLIHQAWEQVHGLTYYIGRFQQLSDEEEDGPLILADSAHNQDGLRETIPWLESFGRPLHIVLGVVNDKDLSKALPLFPKAANYYFVKANIPRGLPAEDLRYAAKAYGLEGLAFESVISGYKAAVDGANGDELVFVGGSIFTVAEVL